MLTGTPAGVGPIVPGDLVECDLADGSTGKVFDTISFSAAMRQGGYNYQGAA
jgi:acylpyruvate hydrolase